MAALPVNVRAEIYQRAFARNEPVDFVHYFNSLDFEFDLRTPNGVSDFHAWHANLGSHACHVTSLQAKFMDALHGRAEEYLEWLDFVVPAPEDGADGRDGAAIGAEEIESTDETIGRITPAA